MLIGFDSYAINRNRPGLYVIKNPDWYKRFSTLLDEDTYRRANSALRKFQTKAAKDCGADPVAFRNVLICLLEEVVFRIQLNTGLPYKFLLDEVTQCDRDIKAAERCRRELGDPTPLPNAVIQLIPLEMVRREVRKALDQLLQLAGDDRNSLLTRLVEYGVSGNSIRRDKKDDFAIIRLCRAVRAFTGHPSYPQIAELLEVASRAKGDLDKWTSEMLRKIVVRSRDENPWGLLGLDFAFMCRLLFPETTADLGLARLARHEVLWVEVGLTDNKNCI